MDITSLSFPIPYLPCILDTDASDIAIGAVLSQKVDDDETPHCFLFTSHEPSAETVLHNQTRIACGHFSTSTLPTLLHWQ